MPHLNDFFFSIPRCCQRITSDCELINVCVKITPVVQKWTLSCVFECLTYRAFFRTAEAVARFRPRCPIIVITRDARVARQMHLYRGCFPLVYDKPPKDNVLEEHDERLEFALQMGKWMGFIKVGNPFVFVSGWKAGAAHTNTIRILTAMDEKIHIAKSLSESADLQGLMKK